MMTLYLICLITGVVFAVLSLVLSGGFEADISHDVGVDAGVDAGGDIAGHDVGVGEVHFPLFSPVVIASFVAAFGAGGIVGLKAFGLLPILSLVVAGGSGVALGGLAGWLLMIIYKNAETNATTRVDSLIGLVAEVSEPISADGVGQITFAGKSQRISGPARGEEKKDIKRHAMVTITKVVGGVYWVREHVDEKLRNVESTDNS